MKVSRFSRLKIPPRPLLKHSYSTQPITYLLIGTTYPSVRSFLIHYATDPKTDAAPPPSVLNIFIAQQIAQLPLASGIVVNVNNPGLCVSELRKEMTGVVA